VIYYAGVTDLLETTPSGLVLPRVCHYPPAPYTSGPEFTELAASAGLLLDPWQAWVLDVGLGETVEGRWASFLNTVVVSRQNGKDAIFEALTLGWLFLTGERLIGHSAHEYKTAMEAFRRVVSLIQNTDDLRRKVKKIINTNGEEGIELLPAPVIISGYGSNASTQMEAQRGRFLARSKGAGRGFSFDKMIWNEAYALIAAQVDAVLPTTSARPNPQLWLGSSPPLDSATGEALFRARRTALAGAAGVMFLDWGMEASLDRIGPCADEDCTHQFEETGCILDDPEMHKATNPAYPHRISPDAIARERAAMNPVGFARERGGAWPPDLSEGFTIITKDQWDAMADSLSGKDPEDVLATLDLDPAQATMMMLNGAGQTQNLKRHLIGQKVFALSVSPRGNGPVRASIGLASRRADGAAHLELILTGQGTSWVPEAMRGLHKKHEGIFIVDPGSPAGSSIADINAAGVPTEPMSTRDVAQAFGMIYDAATSDTQADTVSVVHLGQSEVMMSLQGAAVRDVGEGKAWDLKKCTTDGTPIDSLTKALWGLATKGAETTVAPWAMYA
jgi:hypothetical protein